MLAINALHSSSPKNFAIGPFKPSSSTFKPCKTFCTVTASKFMLMHQCLYENNLLAAPFTLIAFTCPPFSTATVNTLNPQSFANAETSISSIPKRVSGLSEP